MESTESNFTSKLQIRLRRSPSRDLDEELPSSRADTRAPHFGSRPAFGFALDEAPTLPSARLAAWFVD